MGVGCAVTAAAWLLLLCAISDAHIRMDAAEEHLVSRPKLSFERSAVESIVPEEESMEFYGRYSLNPTFGDVFLPLRSAVESVPTLNLRTAFELQESAGLRLFVRDSVESFPYDDDDADVFDDNNFALSSVEDEYDSRPMKLVEDEQEEEEEEKEVVEREEEEEEEEEEEKIDEEVGPSENEVEEKEEEPVEDAETFVQPEPWVISDRYAAFVDPPKKDVEYLPQPFRADSPFQQLVKAEDIDQLEQIDEVEVLKQQLGYGALAYSSQERGTEPDLEPYGALAQLKKVETKRKNFNASPKVLCYLTNWAFYRKADGKFVPEHLDGSLCTSIIYSFASLDPDHLNIKEFDPWVDVENEFYRRTVESGVPVLIAMGGWTDSTGDKYSRLAGNEIKRRVFAANLVGFIKRHNFAGLHLDWNYPKCWQSDCSKGPTSDKANLSKLLREIRSEFDRVDKNLQLGVAISGYKEIITEAYELAELSKIVDYLTVMSYDYHGAWEHQTGHVSPLYGRKGDKYPQYNTDFAMQLLVKMGAKKEKLIMGIPFYGQSFTLAEASKSLVGEGVAATGPGEAGELTNQPGMLAYYEICQRIRKNKWLTGRDTERKSGPYAMLQNQWVGYEDAASVEAKARYASNNDFGGVAAWTVDLDDFQNRCCMEAYPLLKAINRALGRISSPPPTRNNCERPPQPVTPLPPVLTTVSSDGSIGVGGASVTAHDHTTSWPSWDGSASTTSTTPITRTTKSTTTTRKPKTTTTTETIWWSSTTTPSTTTTKRPATARPTKPAHRPEQTTIPSPAVVRPVVQATDCLAGQFYRDNSNCNAYYQCIYDGELRQQFCPGGLHWNDSTKNCDWPASAQCTEKVIPVRATTSARPTKKTTTTMRPRRTTKASKRPRPTKPRATTARTTTAGPKTTRATTVRVTTARTTAARTTTTVRTPTKPWSYLSSTNKPTTKRPLPHRTTRRPTAVSHKPIARCNEGEYYSHAKCDQYYICVNGVLAASSCGGDLHWDAIRQLCDWPDNVKCLTTKRYLRIIQFRENPEDPCNGEERVPYPGDCSKFLFCLWNRLQAGDCGTGLHFNQATGNCDWPAAANCEDNAVREPGNEITDPQQPLPAKPAKPSKPAPTTKRPTTTVRTTTTPRPTFPTDKPVLQPLDGYYKVVCYFTNWAWYRKGLGRYTPDNINTDLCTHVVYGFAVLEHSNLIIRTHDSWADIDNNFYTRVSGLKSKGVKVSLALGGWNDSLGDKYSRLVRSATSRARFISQAMEFMEKYGFEGLDLDWEYPVCWQTDCTKGFADEKDGFTALVRELSAAFRPKGLLLSTAVSPSKKIIDAGYDVPEISKYFDWIAVMTYDFHGQWDKKTGHGSPLYHHPDDDIEYFHANFSINYWIEKGAPSRKIVMGMPFYGQSFTLENSKNNGLNAKAPGPGQAGEFTRAAGFLAYYEICDRIKNHGWEVVKDERGRMGPFARKGTQWVAFDDPAMIRKKSQLVRALDLGGGMVWALDLDDFRNRCGEGVYPLLRQIHDVLKDPPKGYESTPGLTAVEPESIEQPQTSSELEIPSNIETEHDTIENVIDPNADVEEGDFELEQQSELTADSGSNRFKVVCYFTNWAWYRQGGGKYIPEDIDVELCTHIVYGFAVLSRDTLTIKPHDSWADLDNKFYERVVALRAKGVKVTVAIGGWNDSAGDKYARLVLSAASRSRFVRNVIEFIEKYGFDGLDLDWEYPVCWQVDCKKGSADEKEGFVSLVRELSEAFKPRKLLLSSAVSPNKKVIDAGYNVPKLSRYFDWIAVMTYDYHGQWDKKTGHGSPMYDHPEGTETFNANFSINYWLQSGADREKIIMGMPMYGHSFSLAQASDHDLNAPTYGGGEAGAATRARGFLSYYEICSNIQKHGWNVVRDSRGRMGPYAYHRDQWVSFDDAPMIRHKSEYVRAMGLGGAMVWALDLDDFKNDCSCESYPLLKTINRVLRNYPGPHPKCKLELGDHTMIASGIGPSQAQKVKPTVNTVVAPSAEIKEPIVEKPVKRIECDGRNFVPHKQDCNKYYICQYNDLIEQRCPTGLHWNENYCDWPQNSKCFVRSEHTTKAPVVFRPTPTTQPKPSKKPTKKPAKKPAKKPVGEPTKKPITRPKPTLPSLPLGKNDDYKVVCYFTNWAWYRRGQGKYVPEDIDENLCTHIVYGFAVLNSNTLTIRPHDSWADIDNHFYERVVAYKAKGLRVSLAIGGWNDSLGSKYARLVLDPEARARFIQSVLDFLEKYGFEGFDLDWEYPVCWQVDCTKGSPEEKHGFSALVRELSEAFKPRGLLLSAAVSPSKKVIDAGYDVATVSRYFDWIAVMTYDFHGHFDKQTGHVAPLYYVDGDTNEYFNANFSIRYWLEKGTPPKKLIMGMPLYGQSFTLADQNENGLNSRSIGPGQAGAATRAGGFLAYYEICEKISNGGWTVVRDDESRIGPYAYKGNQWVSYDDVADIRRKSQFVRSLGLGGGMVWALDLDDFRGRCGCGKHPLLRTINQELRGIPGQRTNDCT